MVNKENSVFSFLPTYWKSDENRSFCKREELLHELKLNVKTLMEHAAICHSVPEDSTLVLNFCELVHECLRTGLKTSPIPFYQCTSTFSLLYKISSQCEAASIVINNFEGLNVNKSYQQRYKNLKNTHAKQQQSNMSIKTEDKGDLKKSFHQTYNKSMKSNKKSLTGNKSCSKLSFNSKIAWIHFALIEDLLENIIRHICTETKEFYNSDSIIADECDVNVFLSLISGPCAISYTSAIHEDSYWSNLHADELIERQRFTSITVKSQITGRSLQVCQKMKSSICFPENYEKIEQKAKKLTRIGNSSSKSDSSFTNNSVDSLYQTRKSTLLYGKNNVMLGDEQRVPGYLELINSSSDILIRWTSNDLLLQASDMNISRSNGIEYDCDQYLLDNPLNETNTTEPMNVNKYSRINNQLVENNTAADKYYSFHFDVVTISVNKMQYVHLHQGGSFEYQIVFIGLDGIAYPPIRLQGGLKAVYDFLVCLDQGLRPSAFLNPSPTDLSATEFDQEQNRKPVSKQQTTFKLWSFINFRNEIIGSKSTSKQLNDQINEITDNSSNMDKKNEELKGVVNENKINNKLEISSISKLRNCNNKEIEEVIFKIVRSEVLTDNDDDVFFGQNTKQIRTKSCKLLPDNKSKMPVTIIGEQSKLSHIESLNSTDIIDTIKVQLVLKTFRAWLVYTQNMKNVRKLLSTLVIHPAKMLSNSGERQCEELTKTKWCELFLNVPDKQNFNPHCIYECIYLGGCASEIRNEVWPYLLGIYKWSMTDAEKNTVDEQLQEHYKSKLKEWMKMEEDIRKIEEKSMITKSSASQNTDWENLMQDPSSSNIDYQETVLKQFAHALESVKKDVVRCDRNNCFYSKSDSSGDRNLAIIQRILLTYVWEFLDDEYTQGMCDIVAPLLVLKLENSLTSRQSTDLHLSNTTPTAVNKCKPMNEQREMEQEEVSGEIEIGTYILFKQIMENRMKKLFSRETATFYMDQKFDHIKSLIQVLDPHLIGHLQKFSDFTHFYFCYRWFLLDFKREFKYQDVFRIWEVILCAEHLISKDFSLFIALALIQNYRDVICANHMEFTDILKFFNERAEKHNVEDILNLARHFAATIQTLTSRIKET